jgi:hypothetical protein
MSVCYIEEYPSIGMTSANGPSQMAKEPSLVSQTVAIGAVAPSNAFNVATTVVRIHVDAICSIKFGPAGTVATTSNKRLAANQTEYFEVPRGQNYIVSVISNT